MVMMLAAEHGTFAGAHAAAAATSVQHGERVLRGSGRGGCGGRAQLARLCACFGARIGAGRGGRR